MTVNYFITLWLPIYYNIETVENYIIILKKWFLNFMELTSIQKYIIHQKN